MNSLVWFRNDLRIRANPALNAALQRRQPVLAIYILDEQNSSWMPGSASRWWLHHSLVKLETQLASKDIHLLLFRGNSDTILQKLTTDQAVNAVYWNRNYDAFSIERDSRIKKHLTTMNIEVKSFNGGLLYEPWEILKADGTPYKVFTAYWKSLLQRGIPEPCQSARFSTSTASPPPAPSTTIQKLFPLPQQPDWAANFSSLWAPGENEALLTVKCFAKERMANYASLRDYPFQETTSLLSPYLHFGEISPQQIAAELNQEVRTGANDVIRQLVWREFAYYLLYHFPYTTDQPLHAKFKHFAWRKTYQQDLHKWQKGQTGIPLVDAGMRQLWSTGWMHNRVRMVVASFLTKNLLIPWQEGAKWFWDTLVDADLPNNSMGWQWVAGCGADAAPYFRIFNPVLQGQKFDANGMYVKTWIPELNSLPEKWIHNPWEAPEKVLRAANVQLGKDYPHPVVDLKASRQRALDRYGKLRDIN